MRLIDHKYHPLPTSCFGNYYCNEKSDRWCHEFINVYYVIVVTHAQVPHGIYIGSVVTYLGPREGYILAQ